MKPGPPPRGRGSAGHLGCACRTAGSHWNRQPGQGAAGLYRGDGQPRILAFILPQSAGIEKFAMLDGRTDHDRARPRRLPSIVHLYNHRGQSPGSGAGTRLGRSLRRFGQLQGVSDGVGGALSELRLRHLGRRRTLGGMPVGAVEHTAGPVAHTAGPIRESGPISLRPV